MNAPPALNDNDGTDLKAWLASIPSFAHDWPRGVLCADIDDRPERIERELDAIRKEQ